MLGFDLDWWNAAMLWSLFFAALSALAVVGSQYTIIKLQKQEALDADAAFEKYKLEVAAKVAESNERAATLEKEAAVLRWQLDREIQKRAQRLLTDEQKAALLAELRGKIGDVNIVVQRDVEAQAFAMQLEIVLQEAGAVWHPYQMTAGEMLPAPAGLVMYKPGGATNEADMKDDPLYRALKAANLFGGFTSSPFLSIEQPMGPRLPPDQHILYVGQKPL